MTIRLFASITHFFTQTTMLNCFPPSAARAMAVISLLCCSLPAAGQDFERVRPKEPVNSSAGQAKSLPVPPEVDDSVDDTVLVGKLQGVVVLADPQKVRVEGVSAKDVNASGVNAEAVPFLEHADGLALFTSWLGKPVSMRMLNTLSRDLILYYRSLGRPVVDVSVPAQDITSGVVQIVVIEGRVGKVRAEGNRWFGDKLLVGGTRFVAGDPISSSLAAAELEWLNHNPFRAVDLIYTPGASIGETDLVLKVNDRLPVRVFAGVENTGIDLIGRERMLYGVNYGNLWGLDHQVAYQFTSGFDVETLQAHSLTYSAPLPWRHTLRFFGAYTKSAADQVIGGIPVLLNGEGWQGGMRYNIPLPGTGAFRHDLELGFDYKHSTNDLEFGGIRAVGNATEIFQFAAAYRSSLRDKFGVTRLRANVFFSPGKWNTLNGDQAFQAVRVGAESTYWLGQFEAERLTRLPGDFSLWLRGGYQWANGSLLPSEQWYIGGYSSVRGYAERAVGGDEGLVINAELRSPALKPMRLLGSKVSGGDLQLLAFWDYGMSTSRSLLPLETDGTELMSTGVGLRYTLGTHVSLRFDYGWQLRDNRDNESSRAHFGVELSW